MKRFLWTTILSLVGFAIGWQDQGGRPEPVHVITVAIWFGCIGYGFGRIFDTRLPLRKISVVLWWVLTLALVGPIFSAFVPVTSFAVQVAIAGAGGALTGGIIGFAQLKISSTRRNVDRSAERAANTVPHPPL